MIEVAVGQEDLVGTGQRQGPSPNIESEPWWVNPKPARVTSPRAAFDSQILKLETGTHSEVTSALEPRSRYS